MASRLQEKRRVDSSVDDDDALLSRAHMPRLRNEGNESCLSSLC